MTASELASMLRAKRAGRGKWLAVCPVHGDHKPSLSIAEGRKCVLLKCRSHDCPVKDILGVLGLTWADLYDKPVDPATLRAIRLEDERKARTAETFRRLRLSALDKASLWQAMRDALGGRLASFDGDDRLSYLFSYAMAQGRLYEGMADSLDYPHLRGLGVPKLRRKITAREVGTEIAGRLGVR